MKFIALQTLSNQAPSWKQMMLDPFSEIITLFRYMLNVYLFYNFKGL